MPIDTTVNGSPDSIRAAVTWLTGSLQAQVRAAADDLTRVRNDAGTAWEGGAGSAFGGRMGTGITKADGLTDVTGNVAAALARSADELAKIQQSMAGIRADAASAGLLVTGMVIQEPARVPDVPPTVLHTAAEVAAYDQAVAAVREHDRLAAAYSRAAQAHNDGVRAQKLWADTLQNVWGDVTSKWFFTVGDLAGAASQALATTHASILSKESQRFTEDAAKALERFKTAPPGTPARLRYQDWDSAARATNRAGVLAETAGRVETTAGKLAFRAGAALAVVGVVYDIHNGKPVEQAVVSGAVGFGASLAAGALTGAAIGSFIPVPVVGTVFGAVVGAGVGLFASGAVDSLYQNGVTSVGQAFSDGTTAVTDAAGAVADLGEGVWDAIF